MGYHAETVAYYKVPKRLRRLVILIVISIGVDKKLKLSKPCENCQRMLGGKCKIFYSTDE